MGESQALHAGALSVDIASAVNDHDVLEKVLRRSPDIASGGTPLRIYEGFSSAGAAYNKALSETAADVLVLVHQDVYLPRGFVANLQAQLAALAARDPNWAVAGIIGLDERGELHGQVWSSGLQRHIGEAVPAPTPVITLDEVVLFIRRGAGVAFDETLPSFHLYAADLALLERHEGRWAYVINAPLIHHSKSLIALDEGYKRAYRHMQRKWRAILPVHNLVCRITRSPLNIMLKDFRIRRLHPGVKVRPPAKGDPVEIAQRLGFET